MNSLGEGIFLELLFSTMGVTTALFETVLGGFPNMYLEAVVGLEGVPNVHFLLRVKRELATHFA